MSERGPARVPPQVRMLAEVNAFEPEPGRQPPPRPRWTGWFAAGTGRQTMGCRRAICVWSGHFQQGHSAAWGGPGWSRPA